jgi:hypothetical protein
VLRSTKQNKNALAEARAFSSNLVFVGKAKRRYKRAVADAPTS